MSVEMLKLIDNDASAQLVASHADDNFVFVIDAKYNPHSIILDLDRNQAEQLKLWLEEHLK